MTDEEPEAQRPAPGGTALWVAGLRSTGTRALRCPRREEGCF